MDNMMKKDRRPGYDSGFDGLSGLVPNDTSRRWYAERSPLFAKPRQGGRHH
ncbi:hypothetical protein OEZ60_21480 [Defluviimonas sp. WL0024]|uniref:Uncharacterized protein n=1 Tax=Albidovulum salinarum TaxID=2984153 RepID=A0ABT2X9C0_9RHOB|nr:hypothetical protein [Defluviimonas sp. WL0024]MCU9850551.1 hypothetical protein [Defluviimonas sp. WL0024]